MPTQACVVLVRMSAPWTGLIASGSVASSMRALQPVGVAAPAIRYERPATGVKDQRTRQVRLSARKRRKSTVCSRSAAIVVDVGTRVGLPAPAMRWPWQATASSLRYTA